MRAQSYLALISVLFGFASYASAQMRSQQDKINPPSVFLDNKRYKKEKSKVKLVQGVVKDKDENPIPKAIVELKDLRTAKTVAFITKQDGSYYFDDLALDKDYELRALNQGQATVVKSLRALDTRKKVTLNFKFEDAVAQEAGKPQTAQR